MLYWIYFYEDYYNSVKDIVSTRYDNTGYVSDFIEEFKVIVWNMDHLNNKHIKVTRNANKGVTLKLGGGITSLHVKGYHTLAKVGYLHFTSDNVPFLDKGVTLSLPAPDRGVSKYVEGFIKPIKKTDGVVI